MRPANEYVSKKTISGLVVNSISATQRSGFCASANDRRDEKQYPIKKCNLSCACQADYNKTFLSIDTIQTIIQQFLIDKKMAKEKLANILGVTTEELTLLILRKGESKLIAKINLPLIRLYCKTRWI